MTLDATLSRILSERIVVLDGAMGTMIQTYQLDEDGYRGKRFASHEQPLKGCNDLLVLTQPQIVADVHRAFLDAGADIIETNTFNAQTISMADYGLESHVLEINESAARLARKVADDVTRSTPQRPRFVAGSIGPTNRTASMSPDVNNPAFRAITFDQLVAAYAEQVRGLIAGGVDLLQPETTFDTLNLKAALFAIENVFNELGRRLPVITSVTITDASGRTLSGQTLEAFWVSIAPWRPFAVGINCALGAEQMRGHVEELSRMSNSYLACYPNAGLPNAFGGYDETPERMAGLLRDFAEAGWLNIVGGCCGTRPEHIAAIADAVAGCAPRRPASASIYSQLSGLEPLTIRPESNLVMIGERTNVTGSRRFARLIKEQKLEQALQVAAKQVEGGANVIDVNMDEGLLDSEAAMTGFLHLIAAEPDIARVPVMIDSSRWSVLEAGLKCLQGKGIVNSISLKEGEETFRQQAELVRRYGAAVVVMAFDEEGQAVDVERKLAIALRAHRILTEDLGFPEQDIIFDLNILTVGTGIEEHADYAIAFIEATRATKQALPQVKVSGGVSNISFAFRGNDAVREAMHAAFLYHARRAGLDLAIVNAGQLAVYEDIDPALRERVEDVLFNRRPDATERLVTFADTVGKTKRADTRDLSWRTQPAGARLAHAVVHGLVEYLETDLQEALESLPGPLEIIEGPLMEGMSVVGDRFGEGKMFLPQVVKSARVMKKAVAWLQPLMEAERQRSATEARQAPKVLLGTVKGDVHDIGKNIVAVVLRCNGYEVIDLGVMVPADKLLQAVGDEGADVLGLSGLITPSLDEMVHVAKEMKRRGMQLPLLIGGATTSRKHTAVKIATEYTGLTVHVADASRAVGVVGALLSDNQRPAFEQTVRKEQTSLREQFASKGAPQLLSYAEAVSRRATPSFDATTIAQPEHVGVVTLRPYPLAEIARYIDWTPLFHAWELRGVYPAILEHPQHGAAARELFGHARELLDRIIEDGWLEARGVYGLFAAHSDGDDIVLYRDATATSELTRLHTLRQQRAKRDATACYALADFVAPRASGHIDTIGAFAVTAGVGCAELVARFEAEHDDYNAIMAKALADRLAEAFAELLHERVRRAWGYGADEQLSMQELIKERYRGIRPAPGYPACPDHTEKRSIFNLLDVEQNTGITLTESLAMMPAASVSGIYLAHPEAHYFAVGPIGRDQIENYAERKGISVAEAERWLAPNLGYEPNR